MWRYQVLEVARGDVKRRDELLWEQGRSGWELVQVIEGSSTDAADRSVLTLFFRRPAGEDIGV
jgi:hypothetical protein